MMGVAVFAAAAVGGALPWVVLLLVARHQRLGPWGEY